MQWQEFPNNAETQAISSSEKQSQSEWELN